MRYLRAIGIGISLLVLANLLTWYVIGRSGSLSLAEREFSSVLGSGEAQTLHLYGSFDYQRDQLRYPADFSEASRNKLFESLVSRGFASDVVYHEGRFPDGEIDDGRAVVHASVDEGIMSAKVKSSVMIGSYVSVIDRSYIWLFGWIPVGIPSQAVS